jgi:hypothetical protein
MFICSEKDNASKSAKTRNFQIEFKWKLLRKFLPMFTLLVNLSQDEK